MSPAKLMSHDEADYRTTVSELRRCGVCSMYIAKPSPACTLVKSPIHPHAVCDYFKKKEGK